MNVIVRGHIVHKVFATVRHKASVPSNTVFIWRRLKAGLLPTLDVTIQVILKKNLLLLLYLRAILIPKSKFQTPIESKCPQKQLCDKVADLSQSTSSLVLNIKPF